MVASMGTTGGARRRAGESSSDLQRAHQQRQKASEHSGAHVSDRVCSIPVRSLVSHEHPIGAAQVWNTQQRHAAPATAAAAGGGGHVSSGATRVRSDFLIRQRAQQQPAEPSTPTHMLPTSIRHEYAAAGSSQWLCLRRHSVTLRAQTAAQLIGTRKLNHFQHSRRAGGGPVEK